MKFLEKRIPVLMYHQISAEAAPSSLVISPKSFERQVNWLESQKFRFLTLDQVADQKGKVLLWERSIALTFDDGFRDNRSALELLAQRKNPAALFIVVNWVGQNGFLNWKEIQELSDLGITIGSHTLTHRWLPEIKDDGELRQEISESKKRIEDELGKEVHHFCYPVGGVDQRVADQVKGAGYRTAWLAGARPTVKIKEPLLGFRRVKVTPKDESVPHFAVKAYGAKSLF